MPDQPISPVPPNLDGTCPPGYVFNASDALCYLLGPPVGNTPQGISFPDVDPRNQAKLAGEGTADSSLLYKGVVLFWHQMTKNVHREIRECGLPIPPSLDPIIKAAVSLVQLFIDGYDFLICLMVSFVGASASRNIPGFWGMIGGLLSDLLGVNVNGAELFQEFQTRGTLPGMRDVGSKLVNLLIGEFTGTAGGTGGEVTFSSDVNPATALPRGELTPAGGVAAAQALMGFVLSSAVRQANLMAIGKQIPFKMGRHLETFSESMRTNIGIGRMMRFALRPIFQDLCATPLKWAVNKEYRPKLLNSIEATRKRWAVDQDDSAYLEELARDGYTEEKARALLAMHSRRPDARELNTLRAAGVLTDDNFDAQLRALGFDPAFAQFMREQFDFEPVRRVSLAILEHYMLQFARGDITGAALNSFVDGLEKEKLFLTPGEIAAARELAKVLAVTARLRPRHLSVGQLRQAYIDGTITLVEYEDHLRGLGYNEADVQTLGIEVLIAQKNHQAAAAKHAAAGKKGAGAKPAAPAAPAAPTPGP